MAQFTAIHGIKASSKNPIPRSAVLPAAALLAGAAMLLAGEPVSQAEPKVRLGGDMVVTESQAAWLLSTAAKSPRASQQGVLTWTNGVVPYSFDSSVSSAKRQLFLDAAAEWAMLARLSFVPRTTESIYVRVFEEAGLDGGYANLGRTFSGAADFAIGPASWSRHVLLHELGHLLGLIHEHQRSDRDSYVSILCANLADGVECNTGNIFGKLTNSRQTDIAYDFYSIMHYFRTAYSRDGVLPVVEPLPAYSQYASRIGGDWLGFLSPGDRASVVSLLGYGAPVTELSPVVTNTRDSGPGSLRAALYYAQDHPGTTVTFAIPASDPGYSAGVFTIRLTASLHVSTSGTFVDAATQTAFTGNTNAAGPEVMLRAWESLPPDEEFSGLIMRGANCRVRGLMLAGFANHGVLIEGTTATGNILENCWSGISQSGTAALPNTFSGVMVTGGARNSRITGCTLSGNSGYGIELAGANTTGTLVENCLIGLSPDGTVAMSNGFGGVKVSEGATGNTISNCTVSGNQGYGIGIGDTGTTGTVIRGCTIGLAANGETPRPNEYAGIGIWGGAAQNQIGGSSAGAGNWISGNSAGGIFITDAGSSANIIQGNRIGLTRSGAAAGNSSDGIQLGNDVIGTIIGGRNAGEGNVIAASTGSGIALNGTGISGTEIKGNYIGVLPSGTLIPNATAGILLYGSITGTTAGGAEPGAANVIRGNNNYGIYAEGAGTNGNRFSGNATRNNLYSGIGLQDGANRNMPAPSLSAAAQTAQLDISGTLSAPAFPNTDVRLEFFDSTEAFTGGLEEGERFLGYRDLRTNGSGALSFAASLPARSASGRRITATATALSTGDTSPFSAARSVTFTDPDSDGIPSAWESTYSLNANLAADASADPDGDGSTNLAEYLAGTHPRQAASRFTLQAPVPVLTGIRLTPPSPAGVSCILEYSDSLTSGSWTPLAPPFISNTSFTITDPQASVPGRRFYRASVVR